MPAQKVTDQDFIRAFHELQSTTKVAKHVGLAREVVQRRRRRIEKKLGIVLPVFDARPKYNTARIDQKAIATLSIESGQVLIGSDVHMWPGERTTSQRAFLKFQKMLKPFAIILNGDVLDSASNNRHPSIGWENKPTVKEEMEATEEYLDELIKASPNSKRFWAAGNHDLAWESRLANYAPEYAGIKGMHLKDHFPMWIPCWRVDINDDVVVKHRWHNGIHAAYNNALKAGKTLVTGHLHSLKVTPWTDYTGNRYGVDCGTLAEPYTDQFAKYTEMNPVNWRSGFVVLTFIGGRLLYPELVMKFDDDHVEWRGQLIEV